MRPLAAWHRVRFVVLSLALTSAGAYALACGDSGPGGGGAVGGDDGGRGTLPEAGVSRADGGALAFDHAEILAATLARARADLDRSTIAFELVAETFTIQELRGVHETIGGAPLDPGNFRKKFLRMIEDGLIEQARGKRATASKPANIYRFVRAAV